MKAERFVLQQEAYETPAINVVEIAAEGVLCASGTLEEWEDDELINW